MKLRSHLQHLAISRGMAHLWCVPSVLCPGHQEQLSCAGVELQSSEGTQARLVGLVPAWTVHSQPDTSTASASALGTLEASGEHCGLHGRGAAKLQSCCLHCVCLHTKVKK